MTHHIKIVPVLAILSMALFCALHSSAQEKESLLGELEARCAADDWRACTDLGHALTYNDAKGSEQDLSRAHSIFKRACETGGDPKACHNLGIAFADGKGTERDLAKASKAYTLACTSGYWGSCFNLGLLFYEGGSGLKQNRERAVKLFEVTCAKKEPEGCHVMGKLHNRGGAVPQDRPRANAYWKLGCDMDHAESCAQLAASFALGRGMPKADLKAAKSLSKKACEFGFQASCKALTTEQK